ncbi:DUF6333 family protein [Streptomyces sp. NPDC048644]|uniref:DUF6333 family protein n=1 Tax=Streptomyces sp. NPDC048644 TaxID=3365582 RepID=UPI0037136A4C
MSTATPTPSWTLSASTWPSDGGRPRRPLPGRRTPPHQLGDAGGLVLDHCGRRPRSGVEMSVFRVRHTEDYASRMEEMWIRTR